MKDSVTLKTNLRDILQNYINFTNSHEKKY